MMLGKTVPRRTKMHNKTPETPKAPPRLLQDSSKKPPPVAPHEAAVRLLGCENVWSGRLPLAALWVRARWRMQP